MESQRSEKGNCGAWPPCVYAVALSLTLFAWNVRGAEPARFAGQQYATGGEAACVECHDETEEYPVLSILKTRHAVKADSRTPLASTHACQTCHGPSAAHVEDTDVPTAVVFGLNKPTAPQNETCMDCHRGGSRMNWMGSAHESRDLACTSCHTIHVQEDPVMTRKLNLDRWQRADSQAQVCFGCHMQKRAQIQRVSAHPIREGEVRCSDCHNPHGGAAEKNLNRFTVNEVCYTCHAEKRGPFLWEHAPAREDCTICHDPHGSVHRPMLKARAPWLCQQCHMAGFHPSDPYTGAGVVAAGGAEDKLLARSCLNCHTEVHGSNHPSGVRWTR